MSAPEQRVAAPGKPYCGEHQAVAWRAPYRAAEGG